MRAEVPESARKPYDSPVRRAQAAQTRERIVAAGAELVHESPRWDWRDVTVAGVAERAGVHVRTVYRHFASERELQDAVLDRLGEEVGEPLVDLDLERLPEVTARVVTYLSTFALTSHPPQNAAIAAVDERRRQALLDAVAAGTGGWSDADRRLAAAMLDVLWTVNTYDRLTSVWGLDADDASRAVAGLVRLVVAEVQAGRRPWDER